MRFRAQLPLLLLAALALPAQDLVEHSLATAGAAGAATGMQGVGKAAAAIFGKAASTLETANQSAATGVKPKVAAPITARTADALPKYEAAPVVVKLSPAPDPAAVKIGMDAREALAKFGPPAMRLSSADGAHMVETWSYGSEPETVTLTLRDSKVAEVFSAPRAKEANDQAVVILQ